MSVLVFRRVPPPTHRHILICTYDHVCIHVYMPYVVKIVKFIYSKPSGQQSQQCEPKSAVEALEIQGVVNCYDLRSSEDFTIMWFLWA